MNKPTQSRTMPRTVAAAGAALLIATMGLVGCERRDDAAVMNGAPVTTADGSTTTAPAPQATPDRSAELQADASRSMDQARESAKEAGRDISAATRNAVDAAGDKVDDARITTSVNAELAKDESLSAVKINVDTDNGRVALKGTAPSATARERATQLASAVSGVVSVDNQLTVEPRNM